MRKYMASLAVLTFLLFALGAMAQTSGSYGQSNPPSASSSSQGQNQGQSSTTTTTTTSQTTSNPQQASLDGCVVREQADYFLVPRSGSPIKLQSSAGQDFSSKVGQHVQITGNESSLSASAGSQTGAGATGAPSASASAGTSGGMAGATSGTGAQAGTGTGATGAIGAPSSTTGAGASGMATSSDLHSMANQQVDVNNISSVGSCPPNWNPSVPQSSGQSR
jgi:uncharacterized protein YdeI (BOF family)